MPVTTLYSASVWRPKAALISGIRNSSFGFRRPRSDRPERGEQPRGALPQSRSADRIRRGWRCARAGSSTIWPGSASNCAAWRSFPRRPAVRLCAAPASPPPAAGSACWRLSSASSRARWASSAWMAASSRWRPPRRRHAMAFLPLVCPHVELGGGGRLPSLRLRSRCSPPAGSRGRPASRRKPSAA